LEMRHRLRAALGRPRDLDAASRRFIRDFLRGRSRRVFRFGRAWESWRSGRLRGVRESATSLPALADALGAALAEPRSGDRRGGRSQISVHCEGPQGLIVKRITSATRTRAAVDLLRGSPALRGFRIGQRLALLGSLSARPLAALEERNRGRPVQSWLIMQSVGLCDLDAYRPHCEREARRCAIALARWIAEWQVWGIDHRDLKAGNIRVDDRDGEFRFWLIDLEDVRFRRRVSDAARRRALVQLNSSLADEAFSLRSRLLGLDAYLKRLPFEGTQRNALARAIARDSVARNHHWRGDDCEDTEKWPRGPDLIRLELRANASRPGRSR
ncbi:MAG: lipopolysaccharide kinase InaA family protein, partial [Myxococcota bacterium]